MNSVGLEAVALTDAASTSSRNADGVSVVGRATLPRSRLVCRVPIITRGLAGTRASQRWPPLRNRLTEIGDRVPEQLQAGPFLGQVKARPIRVLGPEQEAFGVRHQPQYAPRGVAETRQIGD